MQQVPMSRAHHVPRTHSETMWDFLDLTLHELMVVCSRTKSIEQMNTQRLQPVTIGPRCCDVSRVDRSSTSAMILHAWEKPS